MQKMVDKTTTASHGHSNENYFKKRKKEANDETDPLYTVEKRRRTELRSSEKDSKLMSLYECDIEFYPRYVNNLDKLIVIDQHPIGRLIISMDGNHINGINNLEPVENIGLSTPFAERSNQADNTSTELYSISNQIPNRVIKNDKIFYTGNPDEDYIDIICSINEAKTFYLLEKTSNCIKKIKNRHCEFKIQLKDGDEPDILAINSKFIAVSYAYYVDIYHLTGEFYKRIDRPDNLTEINSIYFDIETDYLMIGLSNSEDIIIQFQNMETNEYIEKKYKNENHSNCYCIRRIKGDLILVLASDYINNKITLYKVIE